MEHQDFLFMQAALELAEKGRGCTSPNPMVGSVVVRNGEIVGRGYHQKAGKPHAEIEALLDAGEKSQGATLYVNLEPCCHYGRTPPCVGRIIQAGIRRVVVAMEDPNPKVKGRGIQELRAAGIEVQVGILENEARKLNEAFIKYITTGQPFVVCKMAMSLDGKIATVSGESKYITRPQSREWVHRLRSELDAVMVGINTVIKDDPLLTVRLENRSGRNPHRVIIDSTLRIPLEARVLDKDPVAKTLIFTLESAPVEKRKHLEAQGALVFSVKRNDRGKVLLRSVLEQLGQMEISSLLIEGGAEINASAFEENLVDKVICFIAPKIIGGRNAPTPVGGEGILNLSEAIPLYQIQTRMLGEDVMIEGYVHI
ncbi:MAG TPA: bifunctional diaminohydroxyphosphoribosylaminopyrimidine deaminase/5-amino-6-(5-phosphoribosylamino)uracil reductase RibD [Candidatus Limnocylindrales bacterium]|nr:bifunctional diaminohydroxyphosphoribosylaminopyrimidine deaminase/5-amino-6-(5-phosphoribosylamino)uracil reductase RibD [Candidatus Limnocylindrales bacterium]